MCELLLDNQASGYIRLPLEELQPIIEGSLLCCFRLGQKERYDRSRAFHLFCTLRNDRHLAAKPRAEPVLGSLLDVEAALWLVAIINTFPFVGSGSHYLNPIAAALLGLVQALIRLLDQDSQRFIARG